MGGKVIRAGVMVNGVGRKVESRKMGAHLVETLGRPGFVSDSGRWWL